MTPEALDITIACILLLSGIVAYVRGIIREAFTIVALIAATTAAYFGGNLMTPAFRNWLHVKPGVGEQAAHAVSKAAGAGTDASLVKANLFLGIISPEKAAVLFSYLSVFAVIYILMSLIGFFLSRTVNESGLSIIDRLLGLAFGLARGFLLVFLFYMPVHLMINYDKYPDWAKNSVSVPVLEQAAVYADKHLDVAKFIENHGDQIVVKLKKPDVAADKPDDKKAKDGQDAAPPADPHQETPPAPVTDGNQQMQNFAPPPQGDAAPAPQSNGGLSNDERNIPQPQTGDLP